MSATRLQELTRAFKVTVNSLDGVAPSQKESLLSLFENCAALSESVGYTAALHDACVMVSKTTLNPSLVAEDK